MTRIPTFVGVRPSASSVRLRADLDVDAPGGRENPTHR